MWVGVHPCLFQIDLVGSGAGIRDALIFIYSELPVHTLPAFQMTPNLSIPQVRISFMKL
jgi:hypothetical protein